VHLLARPVDLLALGRRTYRVGSVVLPLQPLGGSIVRVDTSGVAPALQVSVVGRFTVVSHGTPITGVALGSRKARLLLKILVVERTHIVAVDQLVEALWGSAPPAQAAENVASLVSRVRRDFGADAITGGREGYRLGAAVQVDLDVVARLTAEANRRLDAGEAGLAVAAASRALELSTPGSAFEEEPDATWAEPARAELAATVAGARRVLAEAALASGDPALARTAAQDALAADPYDETACRALMRAGQAMGEPARALTAFAALQDRLATDLGVDPAPETRALHLSILREEPAPAPIPTAPRSAPESLDLVGRSAELARLRAGWNDAAAGTSSLLLLTGEAGIGKTRLCDAIVQVAGTTGGIVMFARCYETERSLFLQPIVEAIASVVRVLPPDVVREGVGDAAAALASLVPDVATVVGDVPAVRRTSAEVERRRAFEAVTTFVRGLTARSPVVLALDDLQNAGRATVELLHYLARHAAGTRLLIVATVRSEEGRDVLDPLADIAIRLDVGPLPAEAVSRLAAAAGQAELSEPIVRRTKGHTLFVVETLRGLVAGEVGVPVSLQDAVLSRVRRAGRRVEDLLRAGAVLGASFDPAVVARMLGEPLPAILTSGEDALAARLLAASGRNYEFTNDLVREVLYATTAAPTRLAFHLQAADLLTDRPEAVGAHASAAGDSARAARAWLRAGEDALRRFAAADAEALLSQCIGQADLTGDLEIRGRALVARSRAEEARGAYDSAMRDLEGAVAAAREVGDQRLEMVALRALGGDAPIALGHPIAHATAHLNRGLQIATSLGDREMEADLLAWLAIIACNGLRFDEAVEYGRRAVAAARASGSDEALAAALDGRKTSLAYQGEVAELGPVIEELEPLLRRLGDLFRLHWTLFESGFAAVAGGDWPQAAARFQLALEANRRSGFTAYEAWHVAHLGWLARLQGRYDEALALGNRAEAMTAELPHAWCGAISAALFGTTLFETGSVPAAVSVLERGRRLAEQDGSEAFLLRCLGPLAEATGSRSVLVVADAMLRRISTPPGSAWLVGEGAYLSVARSWLEHDEPQRAREVLAPMLAAAARIPWVAPLADGSLVDGRAAARLGLDAEARGLFVRAAELASRYGLPRVADGAAAALRGDI
jgi:DNA-binding SARP family transcriptional activator